MRTRPSMMSWRAEELIEKHGAVSEAVARAMAEGARKFAAGGFCTGDDGDRGARGGDGGQAGGDGVDWAGRGWGGAGEGTEVRRFIFPGDRGAVRQRAARWGWRC